MARVGLGRIDAAFEDLEEAGSERVGAIIFLPVDPRFEPLHFDPRYPALLSRLGLKRD